MNSFTLFIGKYWKSPVAIMIYVIVIAIIIYYIGKSMGKFSNTPNPLPKDDGSGAGTINEFEAQFIRQTVERMHYDLDSYLVASMLSNRDNQVYVDFSTMSDTLFVATYNDFNNLYLKEDKGTLKTWISDEYGLDGDVQTIIMQRFAKLNLK